MIAWTTTAITPLTLGRPSNEASTRAVYLTPQRIFSHQITLIQITRDESSPFHFGFTPKDIKPDTPASD